VLLAPDLHKDFINEEGVAEAPVLTLQSPSVLGTEFDAPEPNRLIADDNAALGQQIFYIPMSEIESMVEPHGVSNDVRGEPVAFIQRCGSSHCEIVVQPLLSCQYRLERHRVVRHVAQWYAARQRKTGRQRLASQRPGAHSKPSDCGEAKLDPTPGGGTVLRCVCVAVCGVA